MADKICTEKGCFREKYYNSEFCKSHYSKYNLRKWRAKNPEKRNDYYQRNKEKVKKQRDSKRQEINDLQTKNRRALRLEVIFKYSNGEMKCNHCDINDERTLVIDHINNDGAKERRKLLKGKSKNTRNLGSYGFYYYLRRNNFPNGYQVLCANCNLIKEKERHAKNDDTYK